MTGAECLAAGAWHEARRLYDRRSAAHLAVWLAWDCFAFRGETAVANGWLQRARRLLDGLPPSPELAWLESRESQLALSEDGDPHRARSRKGCACSTRSTRRSWLVS